MNFAMEASSALFKRKYGSVCRSALATTSSDGETRMCKAADNAASIVSLIELRDLVRAYRDGKVEVHAAHQSMLANVSLAHPKREQSVEIEAAELERYPTQARERDGAPKQTPRHGPGR
jgi:hypothetical protein